MKSPRPPAKSRLPRTAAPSGRRPLQQAEGPAVRGRPARDPGVGGNGAAVERFTLHRRRLRFRKLFRLVPGAMQGGLSWLFIACSPRLCCWRRSATGGPGSFPTGSTRASRCSPSPSGGASASPCGRTWRCSWRSERGCSPSSRSPSASARWAAATSSWRRRWPCGCRRRGGEAARDHVDRRRRADRGDARRAPDRESRRPTEIPYGIAIAFGGFG
jgi:hypothetical protein